MGEWADAPERLYVLFEGSRGHWRPVFARSRALRTGIKVRVAVEKQAIAAAQVFLLHRRGDGDMVIEASARREPLLEEPAVEARSGVRDHRHPGAPIAARTA